MKGKGMKNKVGMEGGIVDRNGGKGKDSEGNREKE